jgi:hypothetical protein
MRRSRAVRLTLLPILAASAVAFGQERICLDGTDDENCLQADPQVTQAGTPVLSPVLYGGFGPYFGVRPVVG